MPCWQQEVWRAFPRTRFDRGRKANDEDVATFLVRTQPIAVHRALFEISQYDDLSGIDLPDRSANYAPPQAAFC